MDKDLAIRPNTAPAKVVEMFPDVVKLASITLRGTEIVTIPNYDIYDEPNGNYGIDLRQDGRFIKHRTRPEALAVVKETLQRIKNDKEYADSFFGTGDYSEAALRKSEPVTEIVSEVSAEIKPIQGGTLELK